MLTDAVSFALGSDACFEDFADTARSCMEFIAGLETLTEREAASLVNHLWRDYMAKKPRKTKEDPKETKKHKKGTAPQTAPAASVQESPKQTEPAASEKKIDLNKPMVKKAIEEGQAVLKEGKSKADAAWAIYGRLKDEDKELIVAAFVKGATLTEKGALTYWYNCKRRAAKEATAK
jgi:hypothetical protein